MLASPIEFKVYVQNLSNVFHGFALIQCSNMDLNWFVEDCFEQKRIN